VGVDQDGDLSQQSGERFFKELADFAPVMIWRAGLDGMCDWFNKPWLDFVGRQMKQEVGNGWAGGVHPEDFQRCIDTYMTAFRARKPFTMTYRLRRHDGVFREILDNGAAFYREGAFAGYFGSCIDISDHAAVEAQLRQAQKMEAVGQLTGGVAHDFNNILTGIAGSLELLQTRLAQGRVGDLEHYLHAAQGATRRAARLAHRLLAFSRRQALDPRPTNINQLVTGMEDLVRRSVGPEIATEFVSASGLWSTLVDAGQLENALLNLCINARDAMPDGGKLVIETANRWFDDHAAREQDLPGGQYISLCVSDNGTGMDADTARRAFDPFFTTKPLGHGTGLGLSMVYGFARQSGGQVRIYSEQGKGDDGLYLFTTSSGRERNAEFRYQDRIISGEGGRTNDTGRR
jgi:PAS domain S-box-containing protein